MLPWTPSDAIVLTDSGSGKELSCVFTAAAKSIAVVSTLLDHSGVLNTCHVPLRAPPFGSMFRSESRSMGDPRTLVFFAGRVMVIGGYGGGEP